jgi:hypothetical protein
MSDRVANLLLIRGLELAEGHGLDVRRIAVELREGLTEMTAERVDGDQIRLGLRGRTTRLLGDIPALAAAWQPGDPISN